MNKRGFLTAACAARSPPARASRAGAQDTVKIGLILPMTGPFASTGRQIDAAVKVYMAQARQHGRRQEDRGDPEGRRRHAPTPRAASRRSSSSTTRSRSSPASA